jgi:hypothetical protein
MGDLGGLILMRNGDIPGIGEGVSLACAGVSRQDAKTRSLVGARRLARESRECRESPMRQGHPAVGLTHLCCLTVYFQLSTY